MDKLVMFAMAKLVCGKWSRLSANTFVGFGWLAMPVCTTLRMLRIYLRQQRQFLRSSFIIHVHTFFAQEISTTVRDPSQIFYPVLPLLVDAGCAKSNSPPLNSQRTAPGSH
jgi:hypothetical protein